jgi:glycosyltransferase involved in cell wall biosynthesis
MTLKVSLIITTYNWMDALRAVLNSVTMQLELPYEVIIADDGSRIETTEMISKIQRVRKSATKQLRSALESTWCL